MQLPCVVILPRALPHSPSSLLSPLGPGKKSELEGQSRGHSWRRREPEAEAPAPHVWDLAPHRSSPASRMSGVSGCCCGRSFPMAGLPIPRW